MVFAAGMIGGLLAAGLIAASQTAVALELPEALRAHIKDERFEIVTSIRGLPLGVRDGLQMLFGTGTLDIAESGARFRETEVIGAANLPTRRLIVAGCSTDHCLVYYERGGKAHTWHVALLHWTPAATRFEWGGIAPRGLASVDAVRKAALSGAIKKSTEGW